MGLFDRFRRTTSVDSVGYNPAAYYGAWALSTEEYERILGLSPGDMWRTQPYLRTVVTFLARNIAQLGLHSFLRVDEDDRQRLRDGGLVEAFKRPNRATTAYELVFGLVADLALHDVAYWLVSEDRSQAITRLPPSWVTPKGGDALGPERYEVRINDKGERALIDAFGMGTGGAGEVLAFHGWHPASLSIGSSPVHALREILAEQVQAAKYRENVWRRGGKVGAVLSRPATAPAWSDTARTQFKADWDSKFTGQGSQVGGTPLLEDGMTLNRVDFNAQEMQFIEGSRLALNTVASVYHVNPTMIGLLDNANYSNVREFRRMLYGDTLGPVLAQIEDRINTFLVPRLDSRPGVYVEFNIEEKLQGSFEEQTLALQSSVGRPWMTANEARALRNMPSVEGGDELVTPLNVLVGGQASPTDSAPPKAAAQLGTASGTNLFLLKARATGKQSEKVAEVLTRFFDRQGKTVLSLMGSGGDWWDDARWTKELSDDLHAVAVSITATLGKTEAASLGYSEDDYNPAATINYLRAATDRYASNINQTTKAQLDRESDGGNPAHVYSDEVAKSRASGTAIGVTTFLAGFAAHEAASQLTRTYEVKATKTWVVGPNPRPSHARMGGETVPIGQPFSNGQDWPGSGGAVDEVAGCNCSMSITLGS